MSDVKPQGAEERANVAPTCAGIASCIQKRGGALRSNGKCSSEDAIMDNGLIGRRPNGI